MSKNMTWLASVSVSTLMTACVVSSRPPPAGPPPAQPVEAPPPAPRPPPGPVAADNGQPKMHATLDALERAQRQLAAAGANKGGHRQKALTLIEKARSEVQAGIDYANAHATTVGRDEPPTPPEPVATNVPGAQHQPHMAQTMIELREAWRQLAEAKGDKGGHRAKALALIKEALGEVQQGIAYADSHGGH